MLLPNSGNVPERGPWRPCLAVSSGPHVVADWPRAERCRCVRVVGGLPGTFTPASGLWRVHGTRVVRTTGSRCVPCLRGEAGEHGRGRQESQEGTGDVQPPSRRARDPNTPLTRGLPDAPVSFQVNQPLAQVFLPTGLNWVMIKASSVFNQL